MPMTKLLISLAAAGGLAGSAAVGVPVIVPEATSLPAPDASGWRADPVAAGLDPQAPPQRVATFFAGLTSAQRAALVVRFPAVVGSLDGAPTPLRYAANAHDGRHFLLYDTAGDGRAVEVVGDLATARRIVVIVPGSDTTLADFDRGLGAVARRAPSVQARAVYAAVNDPATAVIAWLGYDSPEGLGKAALREDRAAAGAAALTRFVGGLGVTNPSARIILIGHSYGTVVIGLAASSLPPVVTDIVALGSPGMGVDSAADLKTSARVWAARACADWIRYVPGVRVFGLGHASDPTDADFGARILPSDGVAGHDYYLVPGSSTLTALAALIRLP